MPKPTDLKPKSSQEWRARREADVLVFDGVCTRLAMGDGPDFIVSARTVEELGQLVRALGFPFESGAVGRGSVIVPAVHTAANPLTAH